VAVYASWSVIESFRRPVGERDIMHEMVDFDRADEMDVFFELISFSEPDFNDVLGCCWK